MGFVNVTRQDLAKHALDKLRKEYDRKFTKVACSDDQGNKAKH